MDDTERSDPILRQVPLINNPAYQPPKAVTLNTNYDMLIPSLSNSVVPPTLNLTDEEIKAWLRDSKGLEYRIQKSMESDADVDKYRDWVKAQKIKVAPGFDSFEGVMKPSKHESPKVEKKEEEINEINELDKHLLRVNGSQSAAKIISSSLSTAIS
ncbi:uncharacterized protein RJT20DRAFT_132231 [Scheffersomyces xylosifermentans]|uniref:uncharacterized protein n=1 Tax=Scheffersomyces xylosifermentans TaxID=1304137 RepID=UPI00315CB2D2